MSNLSFQAGALLLAVLLAAPLVQAAPATTADTSRAAATLGTGQHRPWAEGVSQAEQEKAAALFAEANALLKDSVFVGAINKYKEALTHWDHPAIHYNLVLALVSLDQPIEVYEQLKQAMRYGPTPLGDDKFQQAIAYKTLVEKELAKIEVKCAVPGAKVVMDGRPLFTAPGRYEGLVRAGPHTIVATRDGYLTRETSPQLPPGKLTSVDLKLYRNEDLTQYRRRWSSWVPWSVLGAGVAVAATGGVLQLGAKNDFKSYDQAITSCGGCVPTPEVQSQVDSGNRLNTLGIAGYAVGGAAIATGAVLLYLNRAQAYQVDPDALDKKTSVAVSPILAPGEGGVLASVRF